LEGADAHSVASYGSVPANILKSDNIKNNKKKRVKLTSDFRKLSDESK